jgi:PD-(D/E)XK nuclease superfamily
MNKISNSKLDLYETCGLKFKFRYMDNLKGNYTASPLLFGVAIDNAINYILESIRDKKEWTREECLNIFHSVMTTWDGQNRLDFFKNEAPEELKDILDENSVDHQEMVWENIYKRGIACIDVYIKDVLPLFEEIISVQTPVEIGNGDGDSLVGIVDFIAKLKDGRTVLFDNKTASSKYPKNKVVTSQQLSLYLEQFPDIKRKGNDSSNTS